MENTSNELPSWMGELKKKGDGLKLPDGYFESLEQRILDKTGPMERSQAPTSMRATIVNKNGLFKLPRLLAAAAAVAAILVTGWWFVRPQATPAHDLTGEDLQTYILENAHEFEVEQLASISPEHNAAHQAEEVEKTSVPQSNDNKLPEELRPEDLEHLLDDLSDDELQEIL